MVKCMSQIRQLCQATIQFTQDHRGWMPSRGTPKDFYYYNSTGKTGLSLTESGQADAMSNISNWITWRRATDAITGVAPSSVVDQNITYGPLAPYLGGKYTKHTGGPGSEHKVNSKLEQIFRCPSDPLEERPNQVSPNEGYYRYSYSFNEHFTTPVDIKMGTPSNQTKPANTATRDGFVFSGKLVSIINSSQRIMIICEDPATLDDGQLRLDPYQLKNADGSTNTTGRINAVSGRHDNKKTAQARSSGVLNSLTKDSKGPVGFVDAHVEMFGRYDALKQRYTGSPYFDPSGF